MKSSIRTFLLINLLLAIVITTSLTAIGNYYLAQKDIQEHLDALMAVSTLSYQVLLGDDIHQRPIQQIQTALNTIPEKVDLYYQSHFTNEPMPKSYLNKFYFQVWTKENQLLLHSPRTPNLSLISNNDGFSDKWVDNKKWRIFTAPSNEAGIRTVLGEQYNTRKELGHRIAQDDLYIMLLTFPLSGLLIWIIIGRGMGSLNRVAQEVANRAPSHLEPVNLEAVPEEIKPVIDELNKLFYRLKEGFEREKRFAADAAHELRTPLAALKAQAQVALNSDDLKEKNRALHKLLESVKRSTHIIQQLLTMSRLVPEASMVNEFEEVNFIKMTRETLATLAPDAIKHQIELEFEHGDHLPIVFGNATALSILIRNLVDNAIRYSNKKGKVIVRVYAEHNELVLEVHDRGPGIPKELQDRVFERFFRILGNKHPGSGLGLAIVRQVTDLHGGRVELDSPTDGTGLIVKIYFPASYPS